LFFLSLFNSSYYCFVFVFVFAGLGLFEVPNLDTIFPFETWSFKAEPRVIEEPAVKKSSKVKRERTKIRVTELGRKPSKPICSAPFVCKRGDIVQRKPVTNPRIVLGQYNGLMVTYWVGNGIWVLCPMHELCQVNKRYVDRFISSSLEHPLRQVSSFGVWSYKTEQGDVRYCEESQQILTDAFFPKPQEERKQGQPQVELEPKLELDPNKTGIVVMLPEPEPEPVLINTAPHEKVCVLLPFEDHIAWLAPQFGLFAFPPIDPERELVKYPLIFQPNEV